MDLNEVAWEVMSLSLSELQRNRVIQRHELEGDPPTIRGRPNPASAGHPDPAAEHLGPDEHG